MAAAFAVVPWSCSSIKTRRGVFCSISIVLLLLNDDIIIIITPQNLAFDGFGLFLFGDFVNHNLAELRKIQVIEVMDDGGMVMVMP